MRQLTKQELELLQKAIIRKEIAVLELLAEVYDHYISHLEQFPENEFSVELEKLEEKWTHGYCHRLQFNFRKGLNKSIRNLQWNLITSYFSWPKFFFTIIVIGGLILLINLIEPKVYLLTVILPILVLLLGFNLFISFTARKKFKNLRSIFNYKSMGIWVVSEQTNVLGTMVTLPLHFYSLIILIPRIFDIPNLYNNPYYLTIVLIFSILLILHALTCYEAWKIKSKTALK